MFRTLFIHSQILHQKMSATFSVPLPPLSHGNSVDSDSQEKKLHNRTSDETDGISESKSKRIRKSKTTSFQSTEQIAESGAGDKSHRSSSHTDSHESDVESISRPMFTDRQIFDISQKYDFFMILNNCTPFKDLIDLIHPVLEQINFNVIERLTKKGQLFRGITINSMDPNQIAMISARLKFDTIVPQKLEVDQNFCISASSFQELIRGIDKGSSIEIKRLKSGNDVIIRGFNANVKNNESIISIPTIDYSKEKNEEIRFNTMDYKYLIDIDLNALRSLVKLAQSPQINAKNIEFKIYELVNARAGEKINKLCISYDSGPNISKMTKNFFSKTKWGRDTKQTVITTDDYSDEQGIEDETRMELVLFEKFTTRYMFMFLKSMERQIINLYITNDKPLVIIYPLNGGEDVGRCNFILAPAVKEETEK